MTPPPSLELYVLEILTRLGEVTLNHAPPPRSKLSDKGLVLHHPGRRRHIEIFFRMPGWRTSVLLGSGPDLVAAIKEVNLDRIYRAAESELRALRRG